MCFSIKKFKNYINKTIHSISKDKIKTALNRQRLKFSRRELVVFLFAIIEQRKNTTTFKKIYKKFNKKYKLKLSYSGFMQNVNAIAPLFELLFLYEIKQYEKSHSYFDVLGLSVKIIDSSLIEGIKDGSRDYLRHKENTTRRNSRLITGLKIFTRIDLNKRIDFIDITNIRTSDISYLRENQKLIENVNIVLFDSGFNSKAFKKELKEKENLKVIAPLRLVGKGRKGNNFDDFTIMDFSLYKHRYKVEDVYRKLKYDKGEIKMKISFSFGENINKALIYSSCLEYNLSLL